MKPSASPEAKAANARRLEERIERRLAAPKTPKKTAASVEARMAEAIAADPSLAKQTPSAATRRSVLREGYVREAFAAAGKDLGALNSNGVS